MATISSPTAPPAPTLDELRRGYLPRLYLHRSLLRRMGVRLDYIQRLDGRTRKNTGASSIYAAMDVFYSTYILVEQTRKVYELIASHVDVRFHGMRKSLDIRITQERPPEKQGTYHQRVWLYPLLDDVPDTAFTRLGLDVTHARAVLREITNRSAARLSAEEGELISFAERYVDLCNAYKHGRAVFATEPTVSMTGEMTGTINVRSSETTATVLLSETPATPPHSFLTIVVDEAFWMDLDRALSIIEAQLPLFLTFVERFVSMTETAMEQIAAGKNDPLPSIPFFTFGDPYSDEEQRILDTIREGRLLMYETEPTP